MNIYIFGSKDFKKDIHNELEHANIKFRLGDSGVIQDVDTAGELQELIAFNNEDIYLIDDAKIIKNNLLQSKIKFLKPKDGIEETYLKEHGIGDISVDSLSDIPKHIIKKLSALEVDDEDDFLERDEIQDSISDIVQEAFDEDSLLEETEEEKTAYELSKELEPLLSHIDDTPDEDFFGELEQVKDDLEYSNSIENDLSLDEPVSSIEENLDLTSEIEELNYETSSDEEVPKGVRMAEDFVSLDELTESDIQAALNGEELPNTPVKTSPIETAVVDKVQTQKDSEALTLTLDKAEDLSELLTKLLSSKTLEITVKVKD